MNTPDKKLKAAGQSTDSLLTWLQENPKTLGWDAIVVYNRGRANALLMQQYLARLTSANYLAAIDGEIEGSDGSTEHLFGIRLGLPRLSFENADIEHSRARLTMPVSSGLSITISDPSGGTRVISSITRPNAAAGPKLWMDLDLISVPGMVSDVGQVVLDLKDMKNFTTDLMSDPLGKLNAETFFRNRFTALPPEDRVFELGTLNKAVDSALAPDSFKVRTQAAPGAMSRAAINYGDGAVVLFVTLKGGADGGIPTANSDFRYLIPYEDNGNKYSGAVILSNSLLMSKVLKPAIEKALPTVKYAVKTPTDSNGKPLHQYLEAVEGTYSFGVFNFTGVVGYSAGSFNSPDVKIEFVAREAGNSSQQVISNGNTLHLSWKTPSTNEFDYVVEDHWVGGDCTPGHSEKRQVTHKVSADVSTTVSVDPDTSVVSFEQDADPAQQVTIEGIEGTFNNDETYPGLDYLRADLVNIVAKGFFDLLKEMKFPDIDTFMVSNLLFPNSRSLVLKDAFIPGDLALFGNVDPSLTSFVISPDDKVMVVGTTQQFITEPTLTSAVNWSVKGLAGSTDAIGSVSTSGLYTAPTREDLLASTTQLVITATSTSSTGETISSSALISIVKTTITINPIFHTVSPGKTLDFTAGTASGAALTWAMKDPAQGASLVPASGEAGGYTYTAGPAGASFFTLDVVQVTDGNSGAEGVAEANILVIKNSLNGKVEVALEAAKHQAVLSFYTPGEDDDYLEDPTEVEWTLLAGTGKVVDGVYTEPESQDPGFALITCEIDYGRFVFRGYTVLPLPLSEYPELSRVFR